MYFRMASLQVLGYLSEDLEPIYIPQDQMNNILFALLSNFNKDQIELTKIAVNAFARAAPYISENF